MAPAGTQQFTATATGLSSSNVNWYVDNVQGGSSAAGTITADGLYAAPATTGTHNIEAISQADQTVTAASTVAITKTPAFTVSPATANIASGGQQGFTGATCGVTDNNVSWAVDNIAGGNQAVGTIDSGGVYTAPPLAGTHTIKGVDATLSQSSEAIATVASAITVDFGSRTDTRHPIPAGILGVNHVDWLPDQEAIGLVAQAGFTLSRTYANIPLVYAARNPDWSQIDPQIAGLQAAGFHVLLQVAYTPKWMLPKANKCGVGNTKSAPADAEAWAQLAQSFVAHMDATFPGVVTDYEIWNEPDAGGMCATGNKLDSYLALYAAAAPLMKQQAAADGATIRVGGPATSSMNPAWFNALLSNSSTAPYVDFVSYHNYVAGTAELKAAWDTNNGHTPIYQLTQEPTTGPAALFAKAAQLVAGGSQPGGASTPIYVDEFNTNWVFAKDCCRNDPTYAPVWNALYVSDLLDTVYTGTAQVPAQLTYFSANTRPYFCLLGEWDANMDCKIFASGVPAAYPQYYAYELMASGSYLGMNSGGYMASAVSPAASGAGLAATAFYTQNQDAILIVNPTGTSFTQMVSALNTGYSQPTANLYQVMNGQSIGRSTLALTPAGTAQNMTVTLPPYSVLGISIQGP